MNEIRELIKKKRMYFDGGYGTMLQNLGLPSGVAPELWNLSDPAKITSVHKEYIISGADFITTNTFGINADKYDNYEELIRCAIDCANTAREYTPGVYIAFDIGPTGRLLEPLGDLKFDEAVELYSKNVKAALSCGVDCFIIETMNDCRETKAAVLAVRENTDLPLFVTNAYDESGKLMTGADPEAMICMLEGMGVDAVGMNCSFGPDKMLDIIDRFVRFSSLPIIVNPNAGLPKVADGETVYDVSADEFADYMAALAKKGASILGGCCGTTPKYIRKTVVATRDLPYIPITEKDITAVSSYTHSVTVGEGPVLIGERINPTGKPKLKEALREQNFDYIMNEGIRQSDAGVHILDVNVGLPEIDEKNAMLQAVKALQSVVDTPLQLDSSSPEVLECAMRIYNGKPLINSVNGEDESMDAIFPLVKKYGGAVIALTMDKSGIPETAAERIEIAKRIISRAAEYGIRQKDIIVDALCLTVSSGADNATVTLECVEMLKKTGIKTSLGVSNISFGLPARDKINTSFYTSAMERGLDCAIMNPFAAGMMDAYYSFRALHGMDFSCAEYIAYAASTAETAPKKADVSEMTLKKAVVSGLRDDAQKISKEMLASVPPLDVINMHIVPALNEIGKAFEEKRAFLPQLLMSAEAASAAFEAVKEKMPKGTAASGEVILATVKGDIHDIGKNIVRVLLESYGFKVHDLGRDVSPETVAECVERTGCKLVGLSALMTTTVPAMEETIKLLHERFDDVSVIVGGAVLNEEYAEMIKADLYSPDAMDTVRYAQNYYN